MVPRADRDAARSDRRPMSSPSRALWVVVLMGAAGCSDDGLVVVLAGAPVMLARRAASVERKESPPPPPLAASPRVGVMMRVGMMAQGGLYRSRGTSAGTSYLRRSCDTSRALDGKIITPKTRSLHFRHFGTRCDKNEKIRYRRAESCSPIDHERDQLHAHAQGNYLYINI